MSFLGRLLSNVHVCTPVRFIIQVNNLAKPRALRSIKVKSRTRQRSFYTQLPIILGGFLYWSRNPPRVNKSRDKSAQTADLSTK